MAQETARVRSNVRRFRHEVFDVWRCAGCRSIHALTEVDLDSYYRDYPLLADGLDAKLHPTYRGLIRRLARSGIDARHSILDYGCGGGSFVRYLRSLGFQDAHGYDRYALAHSDPSVLTRQYDCVFSQDVVEHVANPSSLLGVFDSLTEPGGVVFIGTPEASAIDLANPEYYTQTLHMPYHRHILSRAAMYSEARKLGWELIRHDTTMYANSLWPGQSLAFGQQYLRTCADDCIDALAEPINLSTKLLSLESAKLFFLGAVLDPRTDVTYAFRRPRRASVSRGRDD